MSRPAKILVVDDTQVNRVVLNRSLAKAGYQVIEADNGYTAVTLARSEQPDLILLDVMMPDRDGFEACQDLKSDPVTAQIPVIFVTAVTEARQIVNAFELGGQDYIAKPFKMAEVLARVGVHLRLRETESELREKNQQLQELASEMTRVSRIDALTRINNRRAWVDLLEQEHQRYTRGGRPYSICVLDVDCFKAYNDSLGHPAGDRCLRAIAQTLEATCRRIDHVGRYGGEEFVVLMPETSPEAAGQLAERIRKAIWNLAIPHPASTASTRVTASIGVAGLSDTWEETLRRADDAMYIAKRAGRNMVFSGENLNIAPLESPPAFDTTGAETLSVLVVDPDPTIRTLCGGALRRGGFEIQEAIDAASANEVIRQTAPDVVLMEVTLPDGSGIDLARELRDQFGPDGVPIVLMSARTSGDHVLQGLEAGADEFIAKPIHAAELVLRIRSLTRMRREHHDLLNEYSLRGDQLRVLSRLVEFCRFVAACEERAEIFRLTAEAAADLARCSRVAVLLPADGGRHLEVTTSYGLDPQQVADIRIPFGEPIAGEVFVTGRRMLADDTSQHTYDLPLRIAGPMLAVPLCVHEGPLGVLCLSGRAGRDLFTQGEVEYIELIARLAATIADANHDQQARTRVSDAIMIALARLAEHRDADADHHVDRVTHYAVLLADQLRRTDKFRERITPEFRAALQRATPLHDIGKVAIPEAILLRPGQLNPAEMQIMQTHAAIGANTIQSLIDNVPGASFLRMAADIARYHHERFDGSGYPAGLIGDAIPLAARIVAVADMYDGMTTARIYKDPIPHEQALAELRTAAGAALDPDIVAALLAVADDFAAVARDPGRSLPPAAHPAPQAADNNED